MFIRFTAKREMRRMGLTRRKMVTGQLPAGGPAKFASRTMRKLPMNG